MQTTKDYALALIERDKKNKLKLPIGIKYTSTMWAGVRIAMRSLRNILGTARIVGNTYYGGNKMRFSITCPECGKVHEITIDEVKPTKAILTTKTEQTVNWADIAKDTRSGKTKLKVGDEITTTLKNGVEVAFVVAHINPYDSNEVAFIMKDCMPDRYCMNKNGSNRGAFCESDMAMYLKKDIFPLLPDDLQAVIKERTIQQTHKGRNSILHCKLWLPSYTELGGTDSDWAIKDGIRFDLFKDEKSKIKQINGETTYWWTRSPFTGSSTSFVSVIANGSSYSNFATNSFGVAFGFLI